MIGSLASSLIALALQQPSVAESDYYAVDYLTPPDGARLEVGGMDFLPDGRMLVSTRRGQVWMIENALAKNANDAKFTLFAEGLQEGLGLKVVGEKIYVLQRAELSELVDNDHDGRCDEIRRVANDWGVSGHYHEFAFGLPRDSQGNFFISLNVSFGDPQWWHGRSTVDWRGWVLKLTPDGKTIPFASGFRSPCGLGMNSAGDLFETDNQGDWMPACPIFHVKEGGFYGHPAALNWTPSYREAQRTASDTIPPTTQRQPAAVWIPYDWSRSAGSLVEAQTGGKFGPFDGQLFVAELTNGMVFRAMLEKVRGEYQGAVIPFRQHVGSAVRVAFAPDGTLFAGFTDRGWGGQAPGDGIGRIRPTGRAPMEIKDVRIRDDGFEVEFTQRLKDSPTPDQVKLFQYDYDYWWEYGSPARHQTTVEVTSVAVMPFARTIWLRAALKPGMCARVRFEGIVSESGEPLLHQEFAYTINQLPSGPECTELVAKLVPPPPAKERSSEGMLELTWADALDSWKQTGWSAHETGFALDPADRKKLVAHGTREEWENSLVLRNDGAQPSDLESRYEFGDIDVHLDFMLPEGGNSGLYLMGRYEVQLLDSTGKTALKPGDCGGIYEAWGEGREWLGRVPMFNAFRGPGQWHGLTVRFRAPKFDASGKKIANALFERVMIDDVLLHENVEVPEPTRGALESPKEVASGPLRIQGDHGPVAIKNVWVRKPTNTTAVAEDAQLLSSVLSANGAPVVEGWTVAEGTYSATDGAKELDFIWPLAMGESDFKLSFDARVGRGASAAVYVRHSMSGDQGYGMRLDAFSKEKEAAGSLIGLAPIHSQLAPPDLWFHADLVVREESKGTRIQSFLNGILVAEHLDPARRHPDGGMAITGPVGGKLELRNLELVRLPPH